MPAAGYDELEEREWRHVPLWGIETWFRYAPRRVNCPAHGVVVEHLPWKEGKRPVTRAMMGFLARWARQKLNALLASKLQTARAWELEETFAHFWKYRSVMWAGVFLDYWCWRARRSRLEPMKKVARMLRVHEELLLNWFRAKGEISAGAVEGLNNKIRVMTRRSYGFRTYDAMGIALFHTLGRLPEPESTHRYC